MNTTSQVKNDEAGGQPMKRADYKAIKHMNKDQLTAYLQRVFMRGYKKGQEDAVMASSPKNTITPDSPAE